MTNKTKMPEIGENVVLPDYYQMAEMINVYLKQGRLGEVEQELHKLFTQGRSLGKREGYSEGLNNGWAIEQDKAITNRKELTAELKEIEYTHKMLRDVLGEGS